MTRYLPIANVVGALLIVLGVIGIACVAFHLDPHVGATVACVYVVVGGRWLATLGEA